MVSGWQEAAAQHAEEVSARLRQLLTSGLGLLRTELGVELGLQPQLYPSWVFLAVPAFLALLLLLLLLHCASARGSPTKRAGTEEEREPAAHLIKAADVPIKTGRAEEPKKKNKKKQPEKAKPNGRPVELAEEEVIAPVKKESPKQPLDADKKNEKVKKNKKKAKADGKQTQSPSQDKKEAEEGNWETKISNKEKRQQRKRDKGTDSEIYPETTTVTESFTMVSFQPTNIRKSKGPSEVSAVNGGGWNEKPTKVIASQIVEEKWAPPAATAGKKKAEPCTWSQDAVNTNGKDWSAPWSERSIFPGMAPWKPVETRISSSEQRPPPFSTIGLNNSVSASVSDPVPQTSASDSQWEASPNEPSVDDEWSGPNGMSSADASSDWNAPAEEWGNYGEEEPVPDPQIEEAEQEVPKVSDDDKEKEETTTQTSASSKTKKKKKKKKKQGDESGSPTQETEGTMEALDDYKEDTTPSPPPVIISSIIGKSNELKETLKETRVQTVLTESSVSAMHNISEKSPSLVQQTQEASTAATKQNIVPPPSQAKSEENWESPKQVKKKKKARRET
ncbi:PREDICTED: protein LYRIC [Nanorana parkeri]|uniref:protein LYRIC n=1 Tax=Nanorana parkeri TaxID=125878 RepID=UPI0008542E4E|nr:PREDICTED: protein LYRIC [Nanorana parkeri]